MKKIMMLAVLSMMVCLVACGSVEGTNQKENDVEENDIATEETYNSFEEDDDIVAEEANDNVEQSEEEEPTEESADSMELTVDADYADLTESEGFVFESNGDGTCTLTDIGVCSDADIVIPEISPEGDRVTMIGEYAFHDAEDISSIVFAGRTMELDEKAFQSCEVEKIVITGCDMVISENAFAYCEDVRELYISNSNLEVASYAFYDMGKDMEVKIVNCTGALDKKAFQSCGVASLVINDSALEIEENAFSYCEDLVEVTFANCTMDIGSYAFYDCGDDAIVTFTNCETELDEKAFQSCGLVELVISGSEMVMGESTFAYCEDLTDVVIGANNIEIGSYSFYDCTSLANVSIAAESEDDNINLVIEEKAFQSCALQNVIIGRGAIELGDNAFAYCENLVSVELKGTLSDLGDYVFYDCPDELVIMYHDVTYNKESIEEAD